MSDTKKLIKEQYDQLQKWVEQLKEEQKAKDTSLNSCVCKLAELSKANVKLVTAQIKYIAKLRKDVSELTNTIPLVSTQLNEAITPDKAHIANAVQKFIQSGPTTPFRVDAKVFQAKVVAILHQHLPNVSTEQIEGMLQHETDVRNEIESRIYQHVMAQLKAEKDMAESALAQTPQGLNKPNQESGQGHDDTNGTNTPFDNTDSSNDDKDEPQHTSGGNGIPD
jgi:hypothetical protein